MKTKSQVTDEVQYDPEFERKVHKGINLGNHNQILVLDKAGNSEEVLLNPPLERKVHKGINLGNHNQTLVIDQQ